MNNMTTEKPKKSQVDKFKEAARELETDDSEEAFDAKLKKIATTKTDTQAASKGRCERRDGDSD